jgi:hypothetical protein
LNILYILYIRAGSGSTTLIFGFFRLGPLEAIHVIIFCKMWGLRKI